MTSRSTPAPLAWSPSSSWKRRSSGPELEHVAEHGDAPAGRGQLEILESCAHRHRVGVVAVIDDDHAAREHPPLAPATGEGDLDRPVRRDAERRAAAPRRRAGCCSWWAERNPGSSSMRSPRKSISTPAAVRPDEADVAARAEPDQLEVVAEVRLEGAARPPGSPRSRPARGPSSSSALAAAIRLDRPEQLEVGRDRR